MPPAAPPPSYRASIGKSMAQVLNLSSDNRLSQVDQTNSETTEPGMKDYEELYDLDGDGLEDVSVYRTVSANDETQTQYMTVYFLTANGDMVNYVDSNGDEVIDSVLVSGRQRTLEYVDNNYDGEVDFAAYLTYPSPGRRVETNLDDGVLRGVEQVGKIFADRDFDGVMESHGSRYMIAESDGTTWPLDIWDVPEN